MAEEEKDEQQVDEEAQEPEAPEADEAAAEETEAEEPAAEAEEPAVAAEDEQALTPKQRRRLERSRATGPPRPQRSPEERAAERAERRRAAALARRRHRLRRRAKRGTGGSAPLDPASGGVSPHGTGTPPSDRRSAPPKVRQGTVVSSRAPKTITVRIEITRRHPTYEKVVRRSSTLHVHDERDEANEGDIVRVVETRPLSRTKRWRLVEILERAR